MRGEGVDDKAVTTYSIDYMYLTEEDNAEEREMEEKARSEHDIWTTDHRGGQEDWKRTRTPGEMQGQWRPLDCDKNVQQTLKNRDTGDQEWS